MATLTSITNANALKWATQRKEVLEKAGVFTAGASRQGFEPDLGSTMQHPAKKQLEKPVMRPGTGYQWEAAQSSELEEARKSLRLLKSKMGSRKQPLLPVSENIPRPYTAFPGSTKDAFSGEENRLGSDSPSRGRPNQETKKILYSFGKNEKKEKEKTASLNTEQERPLHTGEGAKAKMSSIPEPDPEEDCELIDCPEGCGRRFNENALIKHQKVCRKVFQSQRQQFDSAAMRVVSDEQTGLKVNVKKGAKNNKPPQAEKPVGSKKGKWAAQSEAFRAQLKAARGEQITKEEANAMAAALEQDLTKCPHCQRKFNEKAASRHIPFCEQKSKMDKMKSGGGRKGDELMSTQGKKTATSSFGASKPGSAYARRDFD
jgi:hypothetical protein